MLSEVSLNRLIRLFQNNWTRFEATGALALCITLTLPHPVLSSNEKQLVGVSLLPELLNITNKKEGRLNLTLCRKNTRGQASASKWDGYGSKTESGPKGAETLLECEGHQLARRSTPCLLRTLLHCWSLRKQLQTSPMPKGVSEDAQGCPKVVPSSL